jgi:hypothetical protein
MGSHNGGLAELLDVTSHILYAAGALVILRLVTNRIRHQHATAGLIR